MEFTAIFINLYGSVYANVETFHMILYGPFWYVFWIVHLGIGGALPAWLLLVGRRSVAAMGLASGLMAVTFFAAKLNVVIPGMVNPAFRNLLTGYKDPRYVAFYTPTWNEWLIVLGILGLCGILFGLGCRYLPLFPNRGNQKEVAS
jgi:molybdopterin-containing oxidoreductase family membrane subunit